MPVKRIPLTSWSGLVRTMTHFGRYRLFQYKTDVMKFRIARTRMMVPDVPAS